MQKLKIAVVTQQDSMAIPSNIKLLGDCDFIDLIAVVAINHKQSVESKKFLFVRGFGIWQCLKMMLLKTFHLLIDRFDKLFGYRLKQLKSIHAAACTCKADYFEINNPNTDFFISWNKKQKLDLLVSYSAPCIFSPELLNIPKFGCINLHCSILPEYAGSLPSFWALYNGAAKLGASVHIMDDKIDNGPILKQVEIDNPKENNMYKCILATKKIGGNAMLEVLKKLYHDRKFTIIKSEPPRIYYTWPNLKEIKDFKKKGGKLI
jgi:methionyl-tRNA formyltransferase